MFLRCERKKTNLLSEAHLAHLNASYPIFQMRYRILKISNPILHWRLVSRLKSEVLKSLFFEEIKCFPEAPESYLDSFEPKIKFIALLSHRFMHFFIFQIFASESPYWALSPLFNSGRCSKFVSCCLAHESLQSMH